MKPRLILGAVGRQSARGLFITRANEAVSVKASSDNEEHDVPLTPILPGEKVLAGLAERSLRLFEFATGLLRPASSYELRGQAGNERCVVRFRTLPERDASDRLTVVMMSCYYDGFHGDAGLEAALRSKLCREAAFKILLGDNLYMDVPGDSWFRSNAIDDTLNRYLRYFLESGYGEVLSTLPTLATFDDHELWNNFPERVPWLSRTHGDDRLRYGSAGIECLDAFQSVLNPKKSRSHRSFVFEEAPCVSFFFADTRSERERWGSGSSRMMPEAALAALEGWARNLDRPGALVMGQPLWIEKGDWKDYNLPSFGDQYERIWQALARTRFDVVVLSGDVHFSRIVRIDVNDPRGGSSAGLPRPIYEIVSSPASHIPGLLSTATHLDLFQDKER